ncbi:MAG: hypothetical protein MUF71_17705 [Candidatus Kapabacteria bacterium]|jgi:hypothetical protein|nr:hypothetical protein [Candidatus Kapabacteria bacterium]
MTKIRVSFWIALLSFAAATLINLLPMPLAAQGIGTLYGTVTDALTGAPVSNATVSIAGRSVTTNRFGRYTIRHLSPTFQADFVPLSSRLTAFPNSLLFTENSRPGIPGIVECQAPTYLVYQNKEVTIVPCKRTELNISLTKDLPPGSLRFVLTWKDRPADLDVNLFIPSIRGFAPAVLKWSLRGALFEPPFAYLDTDARDGYGPETMTIRQLFPGIYTFSIFNNSPGIATPDNRQGEIAGSGAVVQIYTDKGLFQTLTVPEQKSTTGNAQWWNVCRIDGGTGAITVINQVTNQSTLGTVRLAQSLEDKVSSIAEKGSASLQSTTNASFRWDFGGGRGDIFRQTPEVRYTTAGSYSVGINALYTDLEAKSSITKPSFVSNVILVGTQDFHTYTNWIDIAPSTLFGIGGDREVRNWSIQLLNSGASWYNRLTYGTVADSISQLYVVIAANDTNARVTVSLPDTLNGTIAPLTNMQRQSSEATLKVFSAMNERFVAMAVYTPPPTLRNAEGLNEKIIPLRVQIGTSATQIMPIRLVRPPLVLVHDVGSDPLAWRRSGFAAELERRGHRLFFADYAGESAAAFSPQARVPSIGVAAVTRAIVEARAAMAEQGIACLRVDVVAHGAGGLFARSFLSSEERFFSNQWGSVRRFITLGTPHGGTPLGQYLWERRSYQSASGLALSSMMAQIGLPAGAVQRSLGYGDTSLSLLGRMPYTLSHAIVATWNDTAAQAFTQTNRALGILQTPEEYRRNSNIITALFAQRSNALLVDAESQRSGLAPTSPGVTEFASTLHGDAAPLTFAQGINVPTLLSSREVWKRVGDLLGETDNRSFVGGFPAPPARWWTLPTSTPPQAQTSFGIRIAEPVRGMTVPARSTTRIPVRIETIGDGQLQDVVIALESLPLRILTGTPTSLSTTLSLGDALENRIGPLRLFVSARDARTGALLTDTTTITVQAEGEVEDMQVQPCFMTMEAGKTSGTRQLRTTALIGGVWYDVSRTIQGTQYTTARNLVSINAQGFVTALGGGAMSASGAPDTITVRYGDIISRVPLVVSGVITSVRGEEKDRYVSGAQFSSALRLRLSPQPVQDEATLEYTLPWSAETRLEIISVRGEILATFEQGRQTIGEQRIILSTKGLAKGVYFLRLLVGGSCCGQGFPPQIASVKMVVSK